MNLFKTAVKLFILMTVVTGFLYPLLITGIAQLTMYRLAHGSLIQKGDQTIGSALIAQNTTGDNYFWPRPSAVDYDPMKPSGGSNLGPISQKLKEAIEERKQKFGEHAPAELLYASGSGLDPHMSLETAYFQIPRVAKARLLNETDLKNLIDHMSEGKQFGFFGERYVNVLSLNHALDGHK